MAVSLASHRDGLGSSAGQVRFTVDKVALRQASIAPHIISRYSGLVQQDKQWSTYQVDLVSPHPKILYDMC
jgi:hypothetical protein